MINAREKSIIKIKIKIQDKTKANLKLSGSNDITPYLLMTSHAYNYNYVRALYISIKNQYHIFITPIFLFWKHHTIDQYFSNPHISSFYCYASFDTLLSSCTNISLFLSNQNYAAIIYINYIHTTCYKIINYSLKSQY